MSTAVDRSIRRLESLRRRKPDVVRLARLASLAVRIEPHLLRVLRRELLPDVDVGGEADLWFSQLVESRGIDAIVLDSRVAEVLRADLATERPLLERVIRLTAEAHRSSAPSIRLEEELNGLALLDRGDVIAALDEALQPALRALHEGGEPAREIAQWAARALPRFHTRVQQCNNYFALLLAASAVLGSRRRLADTPEPDMPLESVGWALPADSLSDPVAMGVALVEGGVRFLEAQPGEDAIELPRTSPLLVGLAWQRQGERMEILVEPEPERTVDLDDGVSEVTLRTLAGDEYVLREAAAEESEAPQPKAEPIAPPEEAFESGRRQPRRKRGGTDVFLSYAREDRERAAALAAALEELGIDVWHERDIQADQSWRDTVRRALDESGWVVALWSEASARSDFVLDEARAALEEEKLLLVLLDDVDIPFPFRVIQHLDLRGWKGDASHPGILQLGRTILGKSVGEQASDTASPDPFEGRMPGPARVLISYRRDDAAGWAGRIYDRLQEALGPEAVQMDLEHLVPGRPVAESLEGLLTQADVLLVLIGSGWAKAITYDGSRRLDDPNDYVRQEIAHALEVEATIVPVLVEDADFPRPEELPKEIVPLTHRNALALRSSSFDEDMARLVESLRKHGAGKEPGRRGIFKRFRSLFRGGGESGAAS